MGQSNQNKIETQKKAPQPLPPLPASGVSIPDVVGRLEDLVLFALECEKKEIREGVSFVEVYNQLKEVRAAIDLLDQDQKNLIELMEKAMGGTVNLEKVPFSNEDKKLVEKLQRLQSMCETAKARTYAKIKEHPDVEMIVDRSVQEASMSDKKRAARRKDKFKGVGGKGGWVKS